jgi:fatty-acyl-CoA synthase
VVGCNDAKFGEEIAALIKMKPNTVPFDKMKVYNYCHKQIAHFKVPK